MSVIINDFEVIVESPVQQTTNEPASVEPMQSQPLAPQDIRDIIRYQVERMIRIRAY
jgi:hypothetical protein